MARYDEIWSGRAVEPTGPGLERHRRFAEQWGGADRAQGQMAEVRRRMVKPTGETRRLGLSVQGEPA